MYADGQRSIPEKVNPPISANNLATSLATAHGPDEVPGAEKLLSSLDRLSTHFGSGGLDLVSIIVDLPPGESLMPLLFLRSGDDLLLQFFHAAIANCVLES